MGEHLKLEVESLRRYQNLANAIPHLLWKTGPTGNLVYCNQSWKEYTGYDIEMNGDTKWQDVFEREDLQVMLKVWLEGMRSGSSFDLECRIAGRNGDLRWHWIKYVPEKKDDGEVIGWIGTGTDIHDRKMLEASAAEALEMAESANKEKTYFLANMSHEIRTPLGAIMGFSELLLDAKRTAGEKINFVSIIRNNGKQLLKILDEVLDISKIEAGKLDLELIPIDSAGFFEDLFVSLNLKAVEKNLSLRFYPEKMIPTSFTSDPARLRQIVTNIISNAIRFTERGGVDVLVGWQTYDNRSPKLYIEIRDSGVGIETKYVDKLFNPFVQGDSSTTRRFGGTGLGLALSRKVARALGGDVWLVESSSKGSCFRIEITPHQYSEKMITSFLNTLSPVDEVAAIDSNLLKGVYVLLAEDVLENQLLITHFLHAAGAKTEVVGNGEDALTSAMNGDFDVVLMDIQMPILDGYEATWRLRKQGFDRPILALTAHALNEERQRCLRVGFDDHLTKPVDRKLLIDRLVYFTKQISSEPREEVFLTVV